MMQFRGEVTPDFEWVPSLQRYRYLTPPNKGQFVSSTAVKSLVEGAIAQTQEYASRLNDRLLKLEISVGEWEREMAASIRQASIWNYSIGKGGIGQLTQSDYGKIGYEMRFQLGKLRNFSSEILSGELSDAQIRDRASKYFDRTYGMVEEGSRTAHREEGYSWEKRNLNSGGNECADCSAYKGMGWMQIGTLPRPTESCQCKSNCRCSLQFSNSITKP